MPTGRAPLAGALSHRAGVIGTGMGFLSFDGPRMAGEG